MMFELRPKFTQTRVDILDLFALQLPPIGSLLVYTAGYFTASGNSGFSEFQDQSFSNFKICDGSEYFDIESPIYDMPGRYLPNFTDDRFLMGSSSGGTYGGANTHTLTIDQIPDHRHDMTHDHGVFLPTHGVDHEFTYLDIGTGGEFAEFRASSPALDDVGVSQYSSPPNPIPFVRDYIGNTTSTGSNQLHNNIPNYMKVKVLQRVK